MKEILFALVFVIIVFLLFRLKPRTKTLSEVTYNDLVKSIRATQSLEPSHGIIETHKIFVAGLKSILPNSKTKTAAEVVTIFAPQFKNVNKVWHFHGRRNQVAHEVGIKISPKESLECRNVYIQALGCLK